MREPMSEERLRDLKTICRHIEVLQEPGRQWAKNLLEALNEIDRLRQKLSDYGDIEQCANCGGWCDAEEIREKNTEDGPRCHPCFDARRLPRAGSEG